MCSGSTTHVQSSKLLTGGGQGTLSRKYKELIALGVAFTTQCPYCMEVLTNNVRETGASDPEIAEVVLVAAALRAGGAITHSTHAFNGA
ncbi:MAG: carboxymuconolactone decarboxylase family protein [Nitrospira sp.]|nr:carboxymuconolactone decarboxylase family protein [Nitrospira sp.]MDI3462735.1 hypothetical protein [Nitrospira sp.]